MTTKAVLASATISDCAGVGSASTRAALASASSAVVVSSPPARAVCTAGNQGSCVQASGFETQRGAPTARNGSDATTAVAGNSTASHAAACSRRSQPTSPDVKAQVSALGTTASGSSLRSIGLLTAGALQNAPTIAPERAAVEPHRTIANPRGARAIQPSGGQRRAFHEISALRAPASSETHKSFTFQCLVDPGIEVRTMGGSSSARPLLPCVALARV